MKNRRQIYNWIIDVIQSCENYEQWKNSYNLITLFQKRYMYIEASCNIASLSLLEYWLEHGSKLVAKETNLGI